MKIDIISDTHGFHRDPFFDKLFDSDADLLIHAGDMTMSGEHTVFHDVNKWMGELPHPDKVIIGGNHDIGLDTINMYGFKLFTNAIYLEDSSVKIDDKIIYGTPHTPWDHSIIANRFAFGYERGNHTWSIPKDIDILISHCPPFGYNDTLAEHSSEPGRKIGDEKLLEIILQIKPELNVCGHIHEGYGIDNNDDTMFVNASNVNERYNLVNTYITITI